MNRLILSVALMLVQEVPLGAGQSPRAVPHADTPALVKRLEGLADRTGMNLGNAKLAGKELEKWQKQFYQLGPDGRDFCIKMAYIPDRKTAFYCGGNHGVPHKLSDAWEYHLGSNTWTMLAPPDGGDPKKVIGLYGDIRKGQEKAALELVRNLVVLEDGCLVTKQTKGPINTSHTWDGLTYDAKVKRILWAAPATGIQPKILEELYAKANKLKVEDLRAKLSPGMHQFWLYDFAKNRWVRHTGAGPYPRISFTCTLTYLPDVGKTFYYLSSTRETWLYDAPANKWTKLTVKQDKVKNATPTMELMAAYSPKARKVVCVQGPDTWTFDLASSTWKKLEADKKNDAQDHKGFFGYDPHNEVFLLFQPNMPDKIRVFSLKTSAWTTAEIKGDAPPEKKTPGRIRGYYDPDRNVIVCCKGLSVWVYRYAGTKTKSPVKPQPKGKETTNSLGMKLARIEAGDFIMGAGAAPPRTRQEWDQRDSDEAPAHKVVISKPFFMGVTEVTNAQYEKFDPKHKALRGKHGVCKGDDDPVVMVSWQQAVDFCKWLSKKEGKPYRLPTEAEWEYACRAGTTTAYNTGDTLTASQANFGITTLGNRRGPMPVGKFKPNAWGLHDMHGNVAEWCHDWYGPYEAGKQTDPVGRADGWTRVTRGWSYLPAAHKRGAVRYCRSSNRSGHLPEDANRVTGFRVVQGEMPATRPLPVPTPPIHQQNVKQGTAPKDGPDSSKPYFADVSKKLLMPKNTWGPIFSHWNHFSAITVCPNGDVLAVWYTTVAESGRECAQAATRLRAATGKWDPPSFFFGTPDCNTHAPVLLSDGKRLYHFFTQSLSGWDDTAEGMRTSDDNGATWSKPRIILTREDPLRMSQPCSAFVAKNGKLVLAVDGDFAHRDTRTMTSADRGKTWKVGKGDIRKVAGKYAIHPAVVQRDDKAFLAFLRGPNPMPAFVSQDEGETWKQVTTPFPGIGTGQKVAALKLASGALLVCSFDNGKKLFGGKKGEATSTFAALSLDDGKTWAHGRKVEGPRGYMSLAQGANGVIYLLGPTSSTGRINCVAFNEEWLKEGKALK